MPTQPTDARAPDTAAVRYEVEGKLNPRYVETGDMADYFGIYEVVKWQGDARLEVIETYRADKLSDARYLAYSHARRLQEQAAAGSRGDAGGGRDDGT